MLVYPARDKNARQPFRVPISVCAENETAGFAHNASNATALSTAKDARKMFIKGLMVIKFLVHRGVGGMVRRLREDEGSPVDGLVTERGRGTKNEKENLAFNQRHRFSTQRVDDARPVRTRGGKGRSRGGDLVGKERDSVDAFHREK